MNCDPAFLSKAATAFEGVPEGRKLDILIYIYAQLSMITTDPAALMNLSKCFTCIPPGRKMDVLIYAACNSSGGATATCIIGGVGPPVGVPPCNFSVYIQQPGPNFGLWLGDLTGWAPFAAIAQGP
jgi:hypothetical protein